MPLSTKRRVTAAFTETDGTKSEKWCSLCYENSAFKSLTAPSMGMKTIVDKALVENGGGRLMRWLAQNNCLA